MKKVKKMKTLIAPLLLTTVFLLSFLTPGNINNGNTNQGSIRLYDTVHDTVYIEKIVHDTVRIVNYVDTNVIQIHKKAFIYVKDTFNIGERTFYVTEDDDTIKVFYHDYTYYIFKYFFQDTLVTVDSVIGCDLYTHCICDDRDRIVIFHTCEGESRIIINMLKKEGK